MVASDFDRTLSSEKDGFVMRREVVEEVNRFSKSYHFVVVTGRERKYMEVLAPGLNPTAWVMENGALLVHKVIDVNAPSNWPSVRTLVEQTLRRRGVRYSRGEVIIYVDGGRSQKLELDVKGASIEWNRNDAMIMPTGVNKGTGLTKLKEALNFQGKVIAVGDSENDFALFKVADFKVAVGNALPEVKREADLVLDEDDGEGVKKLLKMIEEDELKI
ncbi:phosphoglycolate phosphatase [Sulfodiicoccus acidiphilus]|nr:phosphoglycolate phosphatase [Sulfodiicoccus acidiphilus]